MNDRLDVARHGIEVELANVAPDRSAFESVAAGEAAMSRRIEIGRDQAVSLAPCLFDDPLAEVSERTGHENAGHNEALGTT